MTTDGHPLGCECNICKEYTKQLLSETQTVSESGKKKVNIIIDYQYDKNCEYLLFKNDNPYDMALYHLITHARKLRNERIAKRGEDYETVWKEMKLEWDSAIICMKALRLDHAVRNNLTDEIIENMVDLFNYLVFGRTKVDLENEEELEDLEINKDSEWTEQERVG